MSGTPAAPKIKPPPPPTRLEVFDAPPPTHRLDRCRVTVDGRGYEIFRAVPRGREPAAGWPLLYALDGNAFFDLLSADMLKQHPGLAIAGIGYPVPLRYSPTDRVLDYTPPRGPGDPSPDPEHAGRIAGGGELFAARLLGPLRSAAEEGLSVDPTRRMIFGHSLAGLFAVHLMLTRPGHFARTVAASPSIWWSGEFALGVEAQAVLPAGFTHDMLVTLGDSERRSSGAGPHWDGPAPYTIEMVRRLRARSGLSVACEILTGAAHADTFARTLPMALAFCDRDW